MTDVREPLDPLDGLAEEFVGRCRAGESPSIDDYAARHPEFEDRIRTLFPTSWETKSYDRLLIHKATYDAFLVGKSPTELERDWQPALSEFRTRRQAFLLYPE